MRELLEQNNRELKAIRRLLTLILPAVIRCSDFTQEERDRVGKLIVEIHDNAEGK